MKEKNSIYRKNFSLVIAFVVLISASLIFALALAYGFTRRYVENDFASMKVDVLDKTIKPYSEFFTNKIKEVSLYNGFLDSASASKYANSVLTTCPFITQIEFYDIDISNHKKRYTFRSGNLSINVNALYRFRRNGRSGESQVNAVGNRIPYRPEEVFSQMAIKLSSYIETVDTSRSPTADEVLHTFYDIKPNRISFLNEPRREELKIYKQLLQEQTPSSLYQQDMFVFDFDPMHIRVINTNPELYQKISIHPVVDDSMESSADKMTTEINLPGAFSEYKLLLSSDISYINSAIAKKFLPVAAIILLIYTCLLVIGWLIFRNLNINMRMFKLQYDFINNLTHEFKTPVSVIKIAGSNLRSEAPLTDRQRKQYGKILNEEADKLNELMNKLLSFTQLENKSITVKKKQIVMEEFVEQQISTFRLKYPTFNLEYTIDDVATFTTDPILLASLFQNMIDNAYKYSKPERKELFIGVSRERKDLILRFEDKGIGIEKRELEHIFKKFYRVQNQYNQDGSAGLGLAFCKELVNFMSGDIVVNSTVGVGTTFIINLPYTE
ncbi:MAG: HAMP domain-containing histidine kinase [Mucilaginibacter polytrichastri]|nr:HAMP domain-containing histidine kinase [Mucilaginibacter polytrichastri]